MTDSKITEPEEKQPENLLTHTFKFEGEEYIYNIDLLSAERILTAVTLFEIHEKMKLNQPATMDELRVIINRKAQAYAMATILVKITRDEKGEINSYEDDFDTFKFESLKPLQKIKGRAEMLKLAECKADFFYHTGLEAVGSLQPLLDLTQKLKDVKDQKLLATFIQNAVRELELKNSTAKNAKTQKSTPAKATAASSENTSTGT